MKYVWKMPSNNKSKSIGKLAFVSSLFLSLSITTSYAEPAHGISMHGTPALPADYKSFQYANPDAPKGGRFNFGVVGTFDSVNHSS